MKNFLSLLALLAGIYLYTRESVAPIAAPVAALPTASAPALNWHLYYHSPLDAPAMAVGVYTGPGYHSTDSASRFGSGAQLVENSVR